MGPLGNMKAFFSWLENATDEDLERRHEALVYAIEHQLTEKKVRADARYLLRKIDQERLARLFR